MKTKLKEFGLITLGTLIITVGVYFFKFPNNFSTGGVSGIAVILGGVFDFITPATTVTLLNVLLLVIGLAVIGRDFTFKTVYCSLLMSGLVSVFEFAVPLSKPLTTEPLLELVFAILLPAVGSAILFNLGASTGGTDIVAMIIKKYTKTNISKALFAADFLIVMATFFVFGVETWLFSFLGFLSKVFLVNNVLESINMSKYCTVITSRENEKVICDYITETLHKSATISESYIGAYRHEDKAVLLAALTRRQTVLLKQFIKTLGDGTFIVVCSTSDIIGKGFRETV